jgi:transposase
MNRRIVKQVAGIDVAQKELVVTLGRMYDDWTPELCGHKVFANSAKGFGLLVGWVGKVLKDAVGVRYVVEATGVYHEGLSYYLDDNGIEVSVIVPSKISNYHRTLEVKTVTDKTSSETIALFGLERKLDCWRRPKVIFKQLRQLVRERQQIVETRTIAKNQLHAEQSGYEPNKSSLARIKQQINFFNKQEVAIKQEIAELVKGDEEVKHSIAVMSSAPGVGSLTATTALAETNGFELVRNKRQLSSYAGFDVREKQSGTSVRGKTRISKKGNKQLRRAMHLPALAAIRSNDRYKAMFVRLVSQHGIKMKAVVAVQRKLLELMYVLYKTNKPYDPDYVSCSEPAGCLVM